MGFCPAENLKDSLPLPAFPVFDVSVNIVIL
jgi:hypothetical protein